MRNVSNVERDGAKEMEERCFWIHSNSSGSARFSMVGRMLILDIIDTDGMEEASTSNPWRSPAQASNACSDL